MNGSYINNLDILDEGMTLDSINDTEVNIVSELLKQFKIIKIKDKYAKFKFTNGTLLIIEISKISLK